MAQYGLAISCQQFTNVLSCQCFHYTVMVTALLEQNVLKSTLTQLCLRKYYHT